jgi:hypothetical protein
LKNTGTPIYRRFQKPGFFFNRDTQGIQDLRQLSCASLLKLSAQRSQRKKKPAEDTEFLKNSVIFVGF